MLLHNKLGKTYSKAFTLIELLVVIFIIALLASLILVNMAQSRKKGRDAKRKADLAIIQQGLEMYYSENHSYPVAIFGNGIPDTGTHKLSQYINIPTDPMTGTTKPYKYYGCNSVATIGPAKHYVLIAQLENKEDSECAKALSGWTLGAVATGVYTPATTTNCSTYDATKYNYNIADSYDSAICL